ncbi:MULTISPECIES: hypothetical protein [Nocardiopsis]|uniref:YtxH domain-containing protein n=1 Tax=Nocardiopsis changdeensis TaxID=2831969 RepID=A0ABX8BRZ5_9ACTN|nr:MULTISPECIES: hypothetical protein [Nocardiopsis]QUX24528.1 hypothetical protein KGD84_09770 [Nocardiopsis changdeensis]QYX34919.1 hypothetical protein K1J57_19230 [Nocardiopsis sp. MT53]
MIRRLLYLAAGAALGGYAVHRVHQARRALTPGGIAERVEDRVGEYKGALRELNEDLAEAVREQEEELLRTYAPRRSRALPPAGRRALPGD